MIQAYFYLGNSYDNMYKPARKGEAENDGLLPKAVKNYEIAVQRETDPSRKKLALQYLAASYGTDKLNDPAQGGTGRAPDDPDGSEGHRLLLRPLQAV